MNKAMNARISDVLKDIGVPGHLKGYSYLTEAIGIVIQDPSELHRITKGVYPQVAEKVGSTPTKVERVMRSAIECALDRCDMLTINRYFGNSISANKGKPTNSEFIAAVAEWISLDRDL